MTKTQQRKLIKRAITIKAQLEMVKPLYRELDEIVAALAASGFSSDMVDKRLVILVDNFEDRNTCFRIARVNRYELKEEAVIRRIDPSKIKAVKAKTKKDPFTVRRR